MLNKLGEFENKLVRSGTGKFGDYIVHAGIYYDLEGQDIASSIDINSAIQIIQSRREQITLRTVGSHTIFKTAGGYSVTNGRWTAPLTATEQLIMHTYEEKDCVKLIEKYKQWWRSSR